MGVRENKVECYLDDQITTCGGLTRKWVSPGVDGVTDRIVIIFGHVFFVEVKTLDGVVSDAQAREQNRMIGVGAKVFNVYGREGVDAWIRDTVDPIIREVDQCLKTTQQDRLAILQSIDLRHRVAPHCGDLSLRSRSAFWKGVTDNEGE